MGVAASGVGVGAGIFDAGASPSYQPTYASDTDATATIQIHRKGYCPLHPDIKIRQRQLLTKSHFPCSRCQDLHDINVKRLRDIDSEITAITLSHNDSQSGQVDNNEWQLSLERLKGEKQQIETKNQELQSKIQEQLEQLSSMQQEVEESKKQEFQTQVRTRQITSKLLKRRMKFTLLGEGRVGKTSFLRRFMKGEYSPREVSTLQASYLTYADESCCIDVWDTAGQERFAVLRPIYYRDADAVLVVYDITDDTSFTIAIKLVREVRSICGVSEVMVFLIGNKCDLEKDRRVNHDAVVSHCAEHRLKHYLVSVKENKGLSECFRDIVADVAEKSIEKQEKRKGQALTLVFDSDDQKDAKKKACCS